MKSLYVLLLMAVLTIAGSTQAAISDFEDLTLASNSYWSGNYSVDNIEGNYDTVVFSSGSASLINHSEGNWFSWAGFAYSNMTDTVTSGYTNQYSAIPGTAHSGSNFVVGYQDAFNGFNPTVTFRVETQVSGLYVTNTTYAYFAMLNGEGPASAFGMDDWFKLTITGKNAQDDVTNTVDFYLAEGTDIVNTWEYVDLRSLGAVCHLEFSFTSSDIGDYGMNTPAYFAMDNLTVVPEPATMTLLGLGTLMYLRKKKS